MLKRDNEQQVKELESLDSKEESTRLIDNQKVDDLKQLDEKLNAARKKFLEQVESKAMLLADSIKLEDVQKEGDVTPHSFWILKQNQIDYLKTRLKFVDRYIYTHAMEFSPLTFEKTKRQAKLDALKSYEILQRVIDGENYLIDPKDKEFFKIHDKAFRNAIIYLVCGVAAILAGIALLVSLPVILFVQGATIPATIPVAESLVLGVVFAFEALVAGGVALLMLAMNSYSNHSERDIFIHDASRTLHSFFHHDAKDLLKTPSRGPAERCVHQNMEAESQSELTVK
jgi:Ca2+/Na+ antiporter